MFEEENKWILLWTVILIQAKFIGGGHCMSDIMCCFTVRPALVMFLSYE